MNVAKILERMLWAVVIAAMMIIPIMWVVMVLKVTLWPL